MPISDSQKVDYLWKKLGYGKTKTDTNANKRAPNEAIDSPLLMRGDTIWTQADLIPSTIPASTTTHVRIYTGTSAIETTEDNTSTANRTWKTGETDWIPPEFGSTYLIKVYTAASGTANPSASGTQLFAEPIPILPIYLAPSIKTFLLATDDGIFVPIKCNTPD